MSQVGLMTRPVTAQSVLPVLPHIQHPLSRLADPENLDVRGSSQAGRPASTMSASGRPLGAEAQYKAPRSRGLHTSGSSRIPSRLSLNRIDPAGGRVAAIETIPEGVAVTQGDPAKPRLPLFGSRAEIASRLESRAGSRLSSASAQTRLEIDEIEAVLKEKIKGNFFEFRKRFKDNDPEGKGNVSRDGLFRILVTSLGRPVTTTQFSRLLDRLGLGEKAVVGFTDFFAAFRDVQSAEYPTWMDPVQRQVCDKATMTATQVHAQLKEKAKQRVRDIADLIPQSNPDGAGHIIKPEFYNALNKLGFFLEKHEFDKLWSRYDPEGSGTVNGERLMQRLGVAIDTFTPKPDSMETGGAQGRSRPLKKKELERQRSMNIEQWLKAKFREGFTGMKKSFEEFDHRKTGYVQADQFLEVLAGCGLRLEKPHLNEFLARCQVEAASDGVPYCEFLMRFQDRSEGGMAHKILTNPKHRYNRPESPGANSTLSALETELMNMFQKKFLSLLGTFHKIDKLGTDRLSQEEFRAAVESCLTLNMTDDQFRALIDHVPLDDEGLVKYADFMSQFDSRGRAPSLFDGESVRLKSKPIGPLPADPSPSPPPQTRASPCHAVSPVPADDGILIEAPIHRSTHELFKIIKDLLKRDYQAVEMGFQELDEWNSRRLSQELMYQLLKRFDVQPEITRGEIRDLWKTFITNQDKTLDFQQFTRHFGYSLKSACFPNAKVNPPKRGDADYMIRSRKLNCAADMLQDNLRAKIDYMWEELREEFLAMDPYKTGYVNADEFRELLSELCVHLSEYELDMLTRKFDVNSDSRVSYLEFLKPFAARKQVWRHGNNMLSLLHQPNATLPVTDVGEPPQKGLHGLTSKLRHKLTGDWKNLRRAFRKMDVNNEGYLSLPEFRSVLKLANVILDEEEVYHVMSRFDDKMTGKIPYNKFLNDTFNPNPRQTPTRKSATM